MTGRRAAPRRAHAPGHAQREVPPPLGVGGRGGGGRGTRAGGRRHNRSPSPLHPDFLVSSRRNLPGLAAPHADAAERGRQSFPGIGLVEIYEVH